MRILYVTPYVPSRIRTRPYHLLRALLSLGHSITLVTSAGTSSEDREQADELAQLGMQVKVFPVSAVRSLANCVRALPSQEPLQSVYAYHPEMAARIQALAKSDQFDVVHIEHIRAARLVASANSIPAVYDSVDCISWLFEQTARTSRQWRSRLMAGLDLGRTRRYEARLLTEYDHVVVTSDRDKLALEDLAARYLPDGTPTAPVTAIVNGVDLTYFQPVDTPRDERTLVFSGKMSYHANVAAVTYLVKEVLPLVWQQAPDTQLVIVGKDPPQMVQHLADESRIVVTGYVEDLRPFLARATASICPIRYAVGVQNKVLEAMAMGTPVVSTSSGCAALNAERGQDVMVADGAANLASAILRVLSEPRLAGRLSANGRRYVEAHHSWESSASRLVAVYEELCVRGSCRRDLSTVRSSLATGHRREGTRT